MRYAPSLLLCFYLVAFVITFGCAFNLEHEEPERIPGNNLVCSVGSAIFWPLYWSVKATQSLRPSTSN